MKRLPLILITALFLLTAVQPILAVDIDDLPFSPGEKLIFSVSYGDTMAGLCVMEVEKWVRYEGTKCLKLTMRLNSSTAFSDFFFVQDKFESLYDPEVNGTRRYEKQIIEGDYTASGVIYYDQEAHTITQEGTVIENVIASGCDSLAAFYHVRTQDISVGSSLSFPYADTLRNELITVDVLAKETVTVPAGTFECYKVIPRLDEETGIFRRSGQVILWVTADEYKIPVKITGVTWFGNVEALLEKYTLGS